MSSEEVVSQILTPEQFDELEKLAGLGWSCRECAIYFGIHLTRFMNAYDDGAMEPGSVRYHYDRGILFKRAKVDITVASTAESGNLTAIQIYKKEAEKNHLRDFKERLINGNI